MRPSRTRQWLRRGLLAAAVMAVLGVAVATVARLRFHGPELAQFVSGTINRGIRGTVKVDTIDWSFASLPRAMAGGWLPVEAHGLAVYDEHGELVLRAKRATAEIDTLALATGPHFHFRNIVIPADADGYALIKEVRQSDPSHEYDTAVVSLVSAFYPKPSPAFHAGLSATSSSIFALDSYRVENVALDFDFGTAFKAQTQGVTGAGWLRSDPTDPLARRLFYSLAPTAKEARITIGSLSTDVRNLEVERLAQMPEAWPRSSERTCEASLAAPRSR